MPTSHDPSPGPPPSADAADLETYAAAEVARLAGVPTRVIDDLVTGAEIATVDGVLITLNEAVRAVSAIRAGRLRPHPGGPRPGVFGETIARGCTVDHQSRRLSAVMTMGLHASALALAVMLTGVHLTTAADHSREDETAHLTRLVFVAQPNPIGGGGGGGLRLPAPPPPAEREGDRPVSRPVPERVHPSRVKPVVEPEPPPTLDNESLPTIFAPLVATPAEGRDLRGLLLATEPTASRTSQGRGEGGGVGAGGGTGIGPGRGSGVGPGSGGGTGGGPYRGGSGIVPPRLEEEIRPRYTEDARQRGIEGDVLLEIVVRADGTVGDVRIVRRLGFGLDEEAVVAVRRWRFAPAERLGSPVDVFVEVAVGFTLR